MDQAFSQFHPEDGSHPVNVMAFLIQQALALLRVAQPVQVKAVTTAGADAPSGFVDVLPLVNMMDGQGYAQEHGTVYHLPYVRMQGGGNAVICDPQVGDIGLAIICDRDISKVKSTKAQANPGSYRRSDLSDGVYLGGMLNGTPTQFLRFFSGGIEMKDANSNTIEMAAAGITINGVLFDRSQNVTNAENVTLQDGVDLKNHIHSDPQGGNTGGPSG